MVRFPALALLGAALLTSSLVACVPGPLRPQRAQVQVSARLPEGPSVALTGEEFYAAPGPGSLLVTTDRPAFVQVIVLPGGRLDSPGAVLLPQIASQPGQSVALTLPVTSGFTQVYTIASLAPLDLSAAAGQRSLGAVSRVVEAAARPLTPGGYSVSSLSYRVAGLGTLEIEANVPGARVSVAGRPVGVLGEGPLRLPDLPEGKVPLSVSREGWRSYEVQATVEAGRVRRVYAVLTPLIRTAELWVSSQSVTEVRVSGRVVGQAGPGQGLELPVPAGQQRLEVRSLEGPGVWSRSLTVRPGTQLRVRCERLPAFDCVLREVEF